MTPVNQEQVVQTAQILLAVISDEQGTTPNKFIEGVVSGKSLLRGLISGTLVVCAADTPEAKAAPVVAENDEKADDADVDAAPDAKS